MVLSSAVLKDATFLVVSIYFVCVCVSMSVMRV